MRLIRVGLAVALVLAACSPFASSDAAPTTTVPVPEAGAIATPDASARDDSGIDASRIDASGPACTTMQPLCNNVVAPMLDGASATHLGAQVVKVGVSSVCGVTVTESGTLAANGMPANAYVSTQLSPTMTQLHLRQKIAGPGASVGGSSVKFGCGLYFVDAVNEIIDVRFEVNNQSQYEIDGAVKNATDAGILTDPPGTHFSSPAPDPMQHVYDLTVSIDRLTGTTANINASATIDSIAPTPSLIAFPYSGAITKIELRCGLLEAVPPGSTTDQPLSIVIDEIQLETCP